MELRTRLVELSWRAPLIAAHGAAAPGRPLILVELRAGDGTTGWGECAPLESYDGVSVAATLAALAAYGPVLATVDDQAPGALLAALGACRARAALPQALAGIDLALWDLAGRRANQPVWRLLGARTAPEVPVNAVIGAEAPETAASQATAAVAAGYRCVKVKVGLGADRDRVRAVRAAVGPAVALRIDANGAWPDARHARAALGELAPWDIELCEEPVHGAAALAELRAGGCPVPIAVDESVADPDVFAAPVADLLCLKLAARGGISGVLADAASAERVGYGTFVASTLDGPLGIAAALHLAAALVPRRPWGLSTLDRFAASTPLPVREGRLRAPDGPGLGDDLLGVYAESNASSTAPGASR